MSAQNGDKSKKSFEFRMSKKVAELTQVVHMLFTRNHEKEVEIEALKKSYEHEIDQVLQDARGRIHRLEDEVAELTRQKAEEGEAASRRLELELSAQEAEWRQKVKDAERLLQEEKGECQNLRDLLINAQRDIENLRQGVTDQLSFKSEEINKMERETERLRGQVAALESELKDSQHDAQTVILELQKTSEKLENEVRQLHVAMENSHKTRDQLLLRNKQLEADMKALRRELNKKAASDRTPQSQEVNEEVERLRREIQRYRLELSNRDNNFNRMFTEKQPLLVNQRSGSHQRHQQQLQHSAGSGGPPIYAYSNVGGGQNHGKPGLLNGHAAPPSAGGPTSGYAAEGSSLGDIVAAAPHSSLGGGGGGLHASSQTAAANFLRTRESVHKIGLMDPDSSGGQMMERQHTMPVDRSSIQDRLMASASGRQRAYETRPRTQGQQMGLGQRHGRLFSYDRQSSRQGTTGALYPEEPSQILPQRPPGPPGERPTSSSLPSICSTPEQRRLSAQANKPVSVQLAKPRPLPREVLYGK